MIPSRQDRFLQLREHARRLLAQSSVDAAGQPPELRAIVEEMQVLQTELELQAEELRIAQNDTEAARRHYFALFDEAPIAFVLLDADASIVELNQRGVELLGLARKPDRTPPFRTHVAREDQEEWSKALDALGYGQRTVELRMRQARSATFTAQCKLSRWSTRNGAPGFLVALVDVTALRDAEHARTSLAEKYEALFDASRDGILVVDEVTRRIVDTNHALCVLLASTQAQIVGRDRDELLCTHRAALDGLRLAEQLRSRSTMPAEVVLQRADGTAVNVDVVVSRMHTGGRLYNVLFVRDASARLDLERDKARVAEGLVRARQLDAIGQLAAGVAHDMNNTLAALAGAVSELERAGLVPHLAEAVDDIAISMRRGSELTTSLLALGQGLPMPRERFDLGAKLQESMRLLGRVLPKSVTVELSLEQRPMFILGDATQWSRVFMNLGVNARDAMPSGGVLRVSARIHREHIHLDFGDDGVGMTDDVRRRAFEPFFTTKSAGEGSGLGLAHVYAVASAHSATVDIESSVGKGTKVRFVLPLAGELESDQVAAPHAVTTLTGSALVVDDDPLVLRSTCRLVTQWGLAATQAVSGPSALELLEATGAPDVVICDLAMPGMNGADLADRIRQRWPDVAVVVVSGNFDDASRARLERIGVRLVNKPFTKESLGTALMGFLTLAARASASP